MMKHTVIKHSCFSNSIRIYLYFFIVGYDNQFPNFPYLWRYNVATNMWKQVPLCATATFRCRRTASFTAAALKFHGRNTLIMYGGTRHPFGTDLSSAITLLGVNK